MVTWLDCSPADEPAASLIAEYFQSRELGFIGGVYQAKAPDPAAFTPPDGVFLVASLDGEYVGCGGVRRVASDSGTWFEVKHLWMQERTRGRGLGRALLVELERRAIELDATDLVLDTNETLAAAGALYRSSGFVEVEPYNDNPNATTWYRKRL